MYCTVVYTTIPEGAHTLVVFAGLLLKWSHTAHLDNKDNQKMMGDPMFMIVQSLRSFLTAFIPNAVIPTAVAPISIILPEFI